MALHIFSSMLVLVLSLLSAINTQYYSQRTKCSENRLSFDSEIANFYQNTQFSGVNFTEVMDVMGMIKKLYHYGKKVDQPINPTHRCQNYFLQTEICCRYGDLDQFTEKMADLFKRTYFKSRHPMVDYIYRIYDTYKGLNSYCLSNFDIRIPDRNGVVYGNSTQPFGDLFLKISDEISLVKQFELDFIYNSACLLCVGIEDLKTFLHPVSSDVNRTKRLIYNQEYWTNATNFIATRMMNCKNYSDQIQSFISTQLRPRLSPNIECSNLTNLVNDSTQVSKRKVCETFDECLRFAEKYMGGPGAPAYSKMFTSIEQKRGITKTSYRLVTSSGFGFKGNQTYQRYEKSTVPSIIIKGNDYTYA